MKIKDIMEHQVNWESVSTSLQYFNNWWGYLLGYSLGFLLIARPLIQKYIVNKDDGFSKGQSTGFLTFLSIFYPLVLGGIVLYQFPNWFFRYPNKNKGK